jgi:hypothetical protein
MTVGENSPGPMMTSLIVLCVTMSIPFALLHDFIFMICGKHGRRIYFSTRNLDGFLLLGTCAWGLLLCLGGMPLSAAILVVFILLAYIALSLMRRGHAQTP